MRLLLGAATMSNPALTNDFAVRALKQKHIEPRDIVLVCNSERVKLACQSWERQGVTVHYPETNLGTCASWNYMLEKAFERGYGGAFILNDDVWFNDERGYLEMMSRADKFDKFLYFVKGLGFSGFCVTRAVWDLVGPFDEGFWPAYFEDNDYHWRAKQAGVEWVDVYMDVAHLGSASLRKWKDWEDFNSRIAFITNRRRYLDKWGGQPGQERWTTPWQGGVSPWRVKDWIRAMGEKPPWDDPFFAGVTA